MKCSLSQVSWSFQTHHIKISNGQEILHSEENKYGVSLEINPGDNQVNIIKYTVVLFYFY